MNAEYTLYSDISSLMRFRLIGIQSHFSSWIFLVPQTLLHLYNLEEFGLIINMINNGTYHCLGGSTGDWTVHQITPRPPGTVLKNLFINHPSDLIMLFTIQEIEQQCFGHCGLLHLMTLLPWNVVVGKSTFIPNPPGSVLNKHGILILFMSICLSF